MQNSTDTETGYMATVCRWARSIRHATATSHWTVATVGDWIALLLPLTAALWPWALLIWLGLKIF